MKRNEFLHNFVYKKLSENRLTFRELDNSAKEELGNLYDQKQLRNLLYNLVRKNKINQDEERRYYLDEAIHKKNDIILDYLNELKQVCKKTEKKLENPFDNYRGDELLEAGKLYDLNKDIISIINKYESEKL